MPRAPKRSSADELDIMRHYATPGNSALHSDPVDGIPNDQNNIRYKCQSQLPIAIGWFHPGYLLHYMEKLIYRYMGLERTSGQRHRSMSKDNKPQAVAAKLRVDTLLRSIFDEGANPPERRAALRDLTELARTCLLAIRNIPASEDRDGEQDDTAFASSLGGRRSGVMAPSEIAKLARQAGETLAG